MHLSMASPTSPSTGIGGAIGGDLILNFPQGEAQPCANLVLISALIRGFDIEAAAPRCCAVELSTCMFGYFPQ